MTDQKQYPDGNKIQVFNYATIENLKPLELTVPVEKQPSNLGMLLACLQKNWESQGPARVNSDKRHGPKSSNSA